NTDGSYTYTPVKDFVGTDSFMFKSNDGQADSNIEVVEITVHKVNQAPVASDSSLTLKENTTGTGKLAATDPDKDTLVFVKVANPSHGTVAIKADGSYSYTPAQDYVGSDSFTFKASDGQADSNTATVTLTVQASGTTGGGGSGGS